MPTIDYRGKINKCGLCPAESTYGNTSVKEKAWSTIPAFTFRTELLPTVGDGRALELKTKKSPSCLSGQKLRVQPDVDVASEKRWMRVVSSANLPGCDITLVLL